MLRNELLTGMALQKASIAWHKRSTGLGGEAGLPGARCGGAGR